MNHSRLKHLHNIQIDKLLANGSISCTNNENYYVIFYLRTVNFGNIIWKFDKVSQFFGYGIICGKRDFIGVIVLSHEQCNTGQGGAFNPHNEGGEGGFRSWSSKEESYNKPAHVQRSYQTKLFWSRIV